MVLEKRYHLRVHHLLCSVLFEGKGYSPDFVKNMTHIVEGIESNHLVTLITEPDIICRECPHRTPFNQCNLDENEVEGKDQRLLKTLQLESKKAYKALELFCLVKENITKKIFEECCKNCQWKELGICSYKKYVENCNELIRKLGKKC